MTKKIIIMSITKSIKIVQICPMSTYNVIITISF